MDWRAMVDAPTRYGTRVLLVHGMHGHEGVSIGTLIGKDEWEFDDGGLITPSHWMPLPSLPNREETITKADVVGPFRFDAHPKLDTD